MCVNIIIYAREACVEHVCRDEFKQINPVLSLSAEIKIKRLRMNVSCLRCFNAKRALFRCTPRAVTTGNRKLTYQLKGETGNVIDTDEFRLCVIPNAVEIPVIPLLQGKRRIAGGNYSRYR